MNQQGDFIIMKLVKTASGKTTIKMSKSEWKSIGKKAGWISKTAQQTPTGQKPLSPNDPSYKRVIKHYQELQHAYKTQNVPAATQAKANLKQMKSFLDSYNIDWKSDPNLFEALEGI